VSSAEALEGALQRAYRYLGRRDRTVAELRKHLLGKGATDAIAEAAIAELIEQGYIDDARFARQFAEDRRKLDAWGSERIERRLLELGVAREHVTAALAGVGEGEMDAAVALARAAGERPRARAGARAAGPPRLRPRARLRRHPGAGPRRRLKLRRCRWSRSAPAANYWLLGGRGCLPLGYSDLSSGPVA
jgi:SOS response regulatory protein OraA/RecX